MTTATATLSPVLVAHVELTERYRFTAEVPRKYVDVKCSCITGADLVEFWGAAEPVQYSEWSVEHLEISDFGILDLKSCGDDQAIELYLYERNSLIACFEVSVPASISVDDSGDWISDTLPGDWHIDEVIPVRALADTHCWGWRE